ncbi:MAG TPA: Ig-like domain-containing protein [Bryobacteraceae bacterium]|nr:Ig-like domain-containing protein [Bryobacteraceae bacterium]
MNRAAIAAAAILLAGVAAAAQSALQSKARALGIELRDGAFRVNGWAPPRAKPSGGWGTVFLVYAGAGKVPPLLGAYAVESGALVFHPRYPIAAGVHYHAVFRAPAGAMVTADFDGPPRPTNPIARVEQVYPTADALPSNLLRLYIVFSAPMSQGEAPARIHIEDEKGKILPDELLPGEELWDTSFRRLTMTFDPGRIKRGLTSNRTIGPPIQEGKRYKLVIDRSWPDARGVPMLQGFARSFVGGPPLRTPPDPQQWRVTAPAQGTKNALAIDFPVAMNYALLQRMIQVARAQALVQGAIALGNHEAEWRFTPAAPWAPGDYQLLIDTGLEDLAGNHIGALFDIDMFEKVTKTVERQSVTLPFRIR